ncbi:hypothetical protein [Burkholderia ubonensis]|uniref:hypothetical protein n=1 Tax=Burkholderia ubonensis TaxID=101571 RepID=UPI0012FB4722|nr:hypothetical protein [Burkholderia ubonensis]
MENQSGLAGMVDFQSGFFEAIRPAAVGVILIFETVGSFGIVLQTINRNRRRAGMRDEVAPVREHRRQLAVGYWRSA